MTKISVMEMSLIGFWVSLLDQKRGEIGEFFFYYFCSFFFNTFIIVVQSSVTWTASILFDHFQKKKCSPFLASPLSPPFGLMLSAVATRIFFFFFLKTLKIKKKRSGTTSNVSGGLRPAAFLIFSFFFYRVLVSLADWRQFYGVFIRQDASSCSIIKFTSDP